MPPGFECLDREGTPVLCDEDTWDDHIVYGHLEMDGQQDRVILAIHSPLSVCQDPDHFDRLLYYGYMSVEGRMSYLRAVIRYQTSRGTKTGHVVTAFPCASIREEDTVIWSRQPKN